MASEYVAGISYYGDMLQTAVLKLKKSGPVLFHLAEEKTNVREGVWFLREIFHPGSRLMKKISALSIGIDNRSVFCHSFPVERALSQPARDEQIDWELSHYIGDYTSEDFVRDVHVLSSDEGASVTNILVVAANRTFVRNIQSLVRQSNLGLQVIETNFFGACYALSVNYPETDLKKVLMVTVESDRVDAAILQKGKPERYRCASMNDQDNITGFLGEMAGNSRVDEIFFAGPAVTHGLVNAAGNELGIQATMLNPVRKLRCKSRYLRNSEFAGVEHRFASTIGCVLRKR